MAMTKMAKDDYMTQSFGEMSQTAQEGTYGLTVGGIYQSSPATIANGEWSPLNTDATGNLMVNLASGDSVSVTVGTINSGTINAGTINSGTINAGTVNAATVNVATVVAPFFTASQTITVGSGLTTGTTLSTINGMIYRVTQAVGTLAGTPGSAATFLVDNVGGTIASLGTAAESSLINTGTQVPITTGFKWITNTSGDPDGTQTGDAVTVVTVHYQK